MFLSFSVYSHGQLWSGILAPSRAVDWSSTNPGVVGGIPSEPWTQCGSTIAAYGSSASPASPSTINTAISGCSSNTYVLLGAGTFYLNSGIVMKSGVELRGSGTNSTFIVTSGNNSCNGGQASICFLGGAEYYGSASVQPGGSNAATWGSGYSQGGTSITVGNVGSDGIANGQYILLDQPDVSAPNSSFFVCDNTSAPCSNEGGAPGRTISSVGYNQIQIVKVTAGCSTMCTGTGPFTLTISPGLYSPSWATGAGVWWPSSVISNTGVQNLSLNSTNDGGQSAILIDNGVNIWVSNIVSIRPGSRNHIWLVPAAHVTIQNSYFFGGGTGGDTTYAVESFISSDNLIQNNIFQQANVPVMMGPALGTVVAYNYSVNQAATPTNWFSAGIWEHDATVEYVLYEGNIGPGLTADTYHGNSNFNTMFRNRFLGAQPGKKQNRSAIALWSYNRYHNIVANILGSPQDETTYLGSGGNGGDGTVYNLGGGNSGENPAVSSDSVLIGTTMRWGNYDSANGADLYCKSGYTAPCTSDETGDGAPSYPGLSSPSTNFPASFYLSSKPSWWQSEPWPAIGPDVSGGNLKLCAATTTYADTLVTMSSSCGGSATTDSAGEANSNPAMDCYLSTMGGPPDGSGSVLSFDANNCYAGGLMPVPPTGLAALVD